MKVVSRIFYPLLLIYEIAICLKSDLFISNLSGLTLNFQGYIEVMLLALLLGMAFFMAIRQKVNFKIKYGIFISAIVPGMIPYTQAGSLISTIHVLIAYLCFAVFVGLSLYILYMFALKSSKGKVLLSVYLVMLMVVFVLNLKYMAINGIIELLFLSTNIVVYGLICLWQKDLPYIWL